MVPLKFWRKKKYPPVCKIETPDFYCGPPKILVKKTPPSFVKLVLIESTSHVKKEKNVILAKPCLFVHTILLLINFATCARIVFHHAC